LGEKMNCDACGANSLQEVILPEHVEDIGGITVRIIDTVRALRCSNCCSDAQTHIPNIRGLVEVVAISRVLLPIELTAGDLKLLRRAVGMKKKEFAEAMNVAPETLSRWEAGAQGMGDHSEKSVRLGVFALLRDRNPHLDVSSASILPMEIRCLAPGETLPIPRIESVVVKRDGERDRVWDIAPPLAA
jgi:transcriptional regulator with XRE-family HTH domain